MAHATEISHLKESNDEFRVIISDLKGQVDDLNHVKATEEERLDKLEQETRAYGMLDI